MKTLCLYASYLDGIGLPYYSNVYLKELKKHYTDIIYLHSNNLDTDSISFFETNSIETKLVSNDGFDFGQWQKVLVNINLNEYDQLCLVNDSCVLFAPLDKLMNWFGNSKFDFGGLSESIFNRKHLQSYFLLFNKSTFKDLAYFFESTKATNNIYQVINDFEIGLCQYLISKNYSCGAFLSNDGYAGEFAPYYKCLESHIKQGSPVIKKKVLFSSYRKGEQFTLARMNFNINADHYINIIKELTKELLIDFDKAKLDQSIGMSTLDKFVYNIKRLTIINYRKMKGNRYE